MHLTPHAVADSRRGLAARLGFDSTPRRVARLAARIAAWTVIAAVAAALGASVVVPRIAGAQPYTIETGSMQPSLPPGTLVVVKQAAAADLGIGDVITYQLRSGSSDVVTHRIVRQGVDGAGHPVFWTRGDANSAIDAAPIRPVQVRGRLWYSVPYLGYADVLLSGGERSLLAAAAAFALFGYAAVMAIASLRARR